MPKKSIAPSTQPKVKPVATINKKERRQIHPDTKNVPVRKPVAVTLNPVVSKKRRAAGKRLLVFGTATVKKGVKGFVHLATLVKGLFYSKADRA